MNDFWNDFSRTPHNGYFCSMFYIAIDYENKTNMEVASISVNIKIHQLFSKQQIIGVRVTIAQRQISRGLTRTGSWITCRPYFPANICSFLRRFEDFFKTCLEDVFYVLKTPSRRFGRRKIVTLKTSSRRLEDISWRRLQTSWRQTKCLLGISVSNKSKCVSNKSIFHKSVSDKSKANPKCFT